MIFESDNLENNTILLEEFFSNSVIQVNKLIDKELCQKALDYFFANEDRLIEKYKEDSKGLVLDDVDNKSLIKYFEYPLSENFATYGPFVNNKIINLASKLLKSDVFLRSMEIHTRGPGSTEIPPHQDNGYYGLIDADALTFYIALNAQSANKGGLTYIRNRQGIEFEHSGSKSKAFSLSIKDENLPKNNKLFSPNYDPGDCTIHHSNSIHYAMPVDTQTNQRSVVVRLTFFTPNSEKRKGHLEWYQNLLKANRG